MFKCKLMDFQKIFDPHRTNFALICYKYWENYTIIYLSRSLAHDMFKIFNTFTSIFDEISVQKFKIRK